MIDFIIFAVALSFWIWVACVLALIAYGARVWVRNVCGNDEIDRLVADRARVFQRQYPNRRHA